MKRLPSWRWCVAYVRLQVAVVLNRFFPPGGRHVLRVLAIVLAVDLAATLDRTVLRPPAPEAQQAIFPWVIQLILLAASYIITAALTPKPKPPEPVKANVPVVEEGKGIEVFFGTVWVEDPTVLAFKEVGTKKIKAKGGKKG
jgi:hypothetical protein